MVKATYVDKNGLKKGAWSEEEDNKLRAYIQRYGHWNWRLLPKFAGLERCGKSCRLRWMNYLKPGIKRGNYSEEERDLIAKLHHELGNKWSAIAARFPGRTDNDIKNYWHTHLPKGKKRRGKSRQQVLEISQEEQSPIVSPRQLVNSELSSTQIFILESSSTNSGVVHWDSDTFVHRNCSDETSPRLIPNLSNSGTNDDGGSFSDLFSGSHESFWTMPFMVDTCSYKHDYN